MDLGAAGAGDVPTKLQRLYEELSAFARQRSMNLHMTGLTRTLVNYAKDSDFPCGHSSSIVIIKF